MNVLIGKRKEDVEVEEVKEGRGAARTTVVCGSASNAVVAHAEVCTALMLGCRAPSRRRGCQARFASRAVAPTLLPVSTLQY